MWGLVWGLFMLCETESEIFSADSRETVFQVARKYLEQLGATGTELVFGPQLHLRVQSDGTRFQEFTQAIAVMQGNQSKRPVSERLREVIRLAELGMKRVSEAAKLQVSDPVADAAKLAALLNGDPDEGPLRAGVALARALRTVTEWNSKSRMCLDYMRQTNDPGLIASLDQTCAELLRLRPAADAVFGSEGDNVRIVRACLALAGDAQSIADLPEGDEVKYWVAVIAGKTTPRIFAAVKLRLRDLLAGPKVLVDEDPRREWSAITQLRAKVTALPVLAEENEFFLLLTRRTNILAGNEKLSQLLGTEKQIGRKMIIALKLMGEVDDSNLKSNLLSLIGHYFELPDLKREFAGTDRAQIPPLFKAVKTALAGAGDISAYRKQRFDEILNNTFGVAPAAPDKRSNDRTLAGPDDNVVIAQAKYKLRNWSPRGLLFGPVPAGADFRPGQKFLAMVLIRNAILSINFEAEAEVVRVTGEVVAVQYKFREKQAEQKVKMYFG